MTHTHVGIKQGQSIHLFISWGKRWGLLEHYKVQMLNVKLHSGPVVLLTGIS